MIGAGLRILVVGAGIAGLGAARALRQVRMGVSLQGLSQQDGTVTVEFDDGRGQVYCHCDAPADGPSRPEDDDVTGRLAELLAGFTAPVPAVLDALGPDGAVHVAPIEEVTLDLAQTHRRDRTRNLPPALRNLILRRWGRSIFHANYRPLLELP